MKRRVTTDWRTKQQVMTITSQYGEALDARQVNWAQEQALYNLLLPAYQVSSETGVATLVYNLTGLTSLKDYVRSFQVSRQNISNWMCDLALTYGRCIAGGEGRYWKRSLLFENECVFIDAGGRMRFVFVPLHGVPFSAGNIPLALLGFLADPAQVTYDNELSQVFAAQLSSYVLGEQGTFSFNSYRALVQQLCGISVSPSGELGQEHERSSAPHFQTSHTADDITLIDPLSGIKFPKTRRLDKPEGSSRAETIATVVLQESEASRAVTGHAIKRLSTGAVFPLQEGSETLVGRGSNCPVCLRDNGLISRQHITVTVSGNTGVIHDLGSSNGTIVSGTKLAREQSITVALPCAFTIGSEDFELS